MPCDTITNRLRNTPEYDLLVAYFLDIEKNRFVAFTGHTWIEKYYIQNMRTPPEDPQNEFRAQ
jgi:hypothetical protein